MSFGESFCFGEGAHFEKWVSLVVELIFFLFFFFVEEVRFGGRSKF